MDTNTRRIILRVLAAFVLGIVVISSAQAFNFARYKKTYLDPLVTAYVKKFPSGMRILPPQKLKMRARLKSMPYKCSTNFLKVVFRMLGVGDKIPVSHCIDIESQRGMALTMFVQDGLIKDFKTSTKIGEVVEFYVDFLYFDGNRKRPGFLVAAFIELEN